MSKNKKLVRELFRNAVFERDGYACKMCNEKYSKKSHELLDAHHITDRNEMPNGGYVKENGISLCPTCHLKAETYHISQKQDFIPNFHPEDLYHHINSSFEKAWIASEKL